MTLDKFKEFFNIKNTNKIVGFTPDYCGYVPSKPVNFLNIFVEVFQDNLNEIKFKFPRIYINLINSLKEFREVFSGSYDSNSGHLSEFLQDNSSKIKASEIIQKFSSCKWLPSPKLDFSDFKESKNYINYNPDSDPGHYTSKLLGYKNKGGTINVAFPLAEKKFDLIRKIPIDNYCLWDILAREKDIKHSSADNKRISTRVVLNTEHHEVILLSFFFQKLMKSISSFYKKDTRFNIAGEYNGDKALKLFNKVSNYDFYLDADWSFFDASIDTEFLKAAGCIMFSNSFNSKEDMRMLYHVISSFVKKYIIVPPGIVVELNRGNPSGHPGVTAVNCYVNLIRWAMIGFEIYGKNFQDYMDVEVYGDDAVVMFKDNPKLFKIDKIIKELGFKSDNLLPKLTNTDYYNIKNDQTPDFLKRRLYNCELCWNNDKLFDKLIYQSKKRSLYDQIDLICNFVKTAPGDLEFNDFSAYILSKIQVRINKVNILPLKEKDKLGSFIEFSIMNLEEISKDYRFLSINSPEKFLSVENKVRNRSICMTRKDFKTKYRRMTLSKEKLLDIQTLFLLSELSSNINLESFITKRSNKFILKFSKIFTSFNPKDFSFIYHSETLNLFNSS